LWQDTKFRWLIASVALVAVFEFLSLLSEDYKLRRELALPFFAAIILAVGWHTLWNGIKALLKINFSEE
jgi:Cd2+/Zn2+-exporting ATPase